MSLPRILRQPHSPATARCSCRSQWGHNRETFKVETLDDDISRGRGAHYLQKQKALRTAPVTLPT